MRDEAGDRVRDGLTRDGFHFPLHVLDEREARGALSELERVERAHGHLEREARDHKLLRFKTHVRFPWLDRIAHHPTLLDAVESFLGPDILIWSSSVFIKEPGDGTFFAWHQDSVTYALDGEDVVSAWIALSPATSASGAMRFIPCSHLQGPLEHVDTWNPRNLGSRGEALREAIEDDDAVDVCLRPGEASLHHLQLVHGSPPNRSDGRRVAYAVRYLSPRTRPAAGRASVTLARGQADPEVWTLEPRPVDENDPQTVEAFRRAVEERSRETFAPTATAAGAELRSARLDLGSVLGRSEPQR